MTWKLDDGAWGEFGSNLVALLLCDGALHGFTDLRQLKITLGQSLLLLLLQFC